MQVGHLSRRLNDFPFELGVISKQLEPLAFAGSHCLIVLSFGLSSVCLHLVYVTGAGFSFQHMLEDASSCRNC